jgi:plastocyanin
MKRTSWIFKVGFGTAALVVGIGWAGQACKGIDCSPERAGQVRCVGNKIETCNEDGTLAYDSCVDECQANGTKKCWCVYYPKKAQAVCTTKDLWVSQVASATSSTAASGSGGAGGASSSTGMGGASQSSAMSSSSTGMMGGPVNGCTEAMAQSATTVNFFPNSYAPNCLKVKVGDTVTFMPQGTSFDAHPMFGGTVDDMGMGNQDPMSPIKATVSGSAPVQFMFPTAGAFGFYCNLHSAVGMKGAVFVTP